MKKPRKDMNGIDRPVYRAIFENMNSGFAYHELIRGESGKPHDFIFLEANSRFAKLTGLNAAGIIGKKASEVAPYIKASEFDWLAVYGEVALSGREMSFERYSKQHGIWMSFKIYSPKKGFFAVLMDDISERKKMELELKASYEKMKSMEQAKADFMSFVTHELRSPMTAVKGVVAFLMGGAAGKLVEKQREFVEMIRNNVERQLGLINDLLDVSKMEAGNFSVTPEPCDLVDITGRCVKEIFPLAEKKRIKITVKSEFERLEILADSHRLCQVVINLLSNSIKFSPEMSEIIVRIKAADGAVMPPEAVEKSRGRGCFIFSVADQGRGIEPANLSRVFDKFFQVEACNPEKKHGTGLGLTIAKNIAEAHGGAVWAESDGPGKGAVFNLLLPV